MPKEKALSSRPLTVPSSGITADLGISYGDAQLVTALMLSQTLRARGISVQWDEAKREGTVSEIIDNAVRPLIEASSCLLAIVTAESVLSDFFVSELTSSESYSKPIIIWQPDNARFDDEAKWATISRPDYLRLVEALEPQLFAAFGLEPRTEKEKLASTRGKISAVKRVLAGTNIIATLTQREEEIESVADVLQGLVAVLRLMRERKMPMTARNALVAFAGHSALSTNVAQRIMSDLETLALANSLGNRGYALQSTGHLEEAWALHLEALALHRQIHSLEGEAIDLGNFGTIEMYHGTLESALSYFLQSLDIHRSIRNSKNEADQLNNAAVVYRLMEHFDEALAKHTEALAIYRRLQSVRGEASQYANMGSLYHMMNRPKEAVEHHERALKTYRELEDLNGQAKCLLNLGLIAEKQDETEVALRQLREALPLARENSNRHDETIILLSIGRIFKAQQPTQAKDYLCEAREAAKKYGFYDLEAAANILLGTEM
jgi:tetratricopeptide (TPR) repeat protein